MISRKSLMQKMKSVCTQPTSDDSVERTQIMKQPSQLCCLFRREEQAKLKKKLMMDRGIAIDPFTLTDQLFFE
jgi:hypothetical protein